VAFESIREERVKTHREQAAEEEALRKKKKKAKLAHKQHKGLKMHKSGGSGKHAVTVCSRLCPCRS
jgi:hypothetical protein